MNNLQGKKLKLEYITRQNILDAQYVGVCENCGRVIVNIATVSDDNGKKYDIGLDCKKALIDKPILDAYKAVNTFESNYSAKEYKQQLSTVEKFLKMCAYESVSIEVNNSEIMITDSLPHKQFPEITGNIIFNENIGYMYKIGLKGFIEDLYKNGIATYLK